MQITPETLKVLQNFATINPNLVIKAGSKLSTINEAKSILSTAVVTETFTEEVGIYDLSNFLGALSLVENPDVNFTPETIEIKGTRSKLKYRGANTSILTKPDREVKMPPADVTLTIKQTDLDIIRKAASALGHKIVSLEGVEGQTIKVVVLDPADTSANSYSLELTDTAPFDFSFHYLIGNIKVIEGDYKVSISKKLLSHWESTTGKIQYWLALEKTSKV